MKKKILAILLGITLLSSIAYASWDSTKPDQADTVAQGMSDILDNFEAVDGTSGSLPNVVISSSGTDIAVNATQTGTGVGIKITQADGDTGDSIEINNADTGGGICMDINQTAGSGAVIDIDTASTGVTIDIAATAGTSPAIKINNSNNQPHINLLGDPTVASPTDGDLWFTGSVLNFRNGATTVNLLSTTQILESIFTYDLSTASGDQAITGVGFQPTALIIFAVIDGDLVYSIGFADSDLSESCVGAKSNGQYTASVNNLMRIITTTGNSQIGDLKTFDADGFTISWVKAGSITGTGNFTYMAFKE